jgi:hypothetical protein
VVGLDRLGDVALGVKCQTCGQIHPLGSLTPAATRGLIAELEAMLAVAVRVHALPVPWVGEPGEA